MITKSFFRTAILTLTVIQFSCSNKTSNDDNDDSLPCVLDKTGSFSISGYSFSFDVSGSYAIVSTDGLSGPSGYSLNVIDISDPSNLEFYASKTIPYDCPGIVIDGTTAYIARMEYRETGPPTGWVTVLEKIDLATSNLNIDRSIDLEMHPYEMALYNGYLYLLGENGLSVINSADIEGGVIGTLGSLTSTRIFIDAGSKRAYVSGQENLLDVYNISTPSAPSHIKSFVNFLNYSPNDIAVRGNLAVLPWGDLGIVVLDISDINNIQLAGNFDTGGHAHAITFRDDYAFIADGEEGIHVMDVTDTSNPVRRGQCKTGGYAWNLKLIGDKLHVLDRDLGLIIYDISALFNE